MRLVLLALASLTLLIVTSLRVPTPASAVVHIAEIHEVMSGFDGNASVQYVEINMRAAGQNVTDGARLSAFDASGTFIDGDTGQIGNQPLVTAAGNVTNSGDGVRWLLGTTAFETAAGVQADFEFPASPGLPTGAGMVCLFESAGDFTNPAQSIDCAAYGGAAFTGANSNSSPAEATFPGPGDCQRSLTRVQPSTANAMAPWALSNDATAFQLRAPSPRNNAAQNGSLAGTNDSDADRALNCQEAIGGSNPIVVDTDADGCADGEEIRDNQATGGRRNPTNQYDFYDIDANKVINVFGDILPVAAAYGDSSGPNYTLAKDRSPPPPPGKNAADPANNEPWDQGPPDGVINVFHDILGAAGQFGHNCLPAP